MNWALITGASQGIGAAISRELALQGWSLILASRRKDKLEAVASSLSHFSIETLCIEADITDPSSVDALVSQINSKLSKTGLKALINNAGSFDRIAFDAISDNHWQSQFEIHVKAPARLCRDLKPLLLKSPGASVLNISSTLGHKPVSLTSAYSAMKSAMNSFTQSLALEWAPHIRVNALCPGIVDTPIHAFHSSDDTSDERKNIHHAHPLKRMGTPEDIARTAAFLLSEASSWTTGVTWNIDGGISLL